MKVKAIRNIRYISHFYGGGISHPEFLFVRGCWYRMENSNLPFRFHVWYNYNGENPELNGLASPHGFIQFNLDELRKNFMMVDENRDLILESIGL